MKMSSSDIKKIAKDKLSFQWGASLLAIALYTFLLACGNVIPVLGSVLIQGPLIFGLYYIYYYQGSKKEKMNLWDMFKGFETNFGETFLASILVGLYTILWSLLFIIPGIIKSFSYSMYMYLMVREPNLSATDAINKSREYMNGHKWQYFCLQLSFLGWHILSLITFGILYVYVLPYLQHAEVEFFNRVYDEKNPVIFDGEAETVETEAKPVENQGNISEEFIIHEAE